MRNCPHWSRKVYDHGARLHRLDGLLPDEKRRGPTGDERRGNHDVRVCDVRLQQFGLALLLFFREFLGVAALVLLISHLDLKLDERGAEALDLLAGGVADIVAKHAGAKSLGGGDRLQSGYASPEHQHLRGPDCARRRRQEREKLREPVGRQNGGAVSAQRAHCGERIHLLRPGNAGHQLHREGRHTGLCQAACRDQLVERAQEPGHDLPLVERLNLVGTRRRDLHEHVGLEDGVSIRHCASRLRKIRIRMKSVLSGA